MALVQIENVSKIYQTGEVEVAALSDITLSIEKSSFVSFVGPSGSGKTTMLNMIGCLDMPTKGKILVDGKQVDSLNRQKRAAFRGDVIGFIFQSFNLFPVLTAYENIEYPLVMIKNVPAIKRKEMILNVTIPANTTAKLLLPANDIKKIQHSGKSINQTEEIKFIGIENGKTVLEVGSGEYMFRIKIPVGNNCL